MITISIIIAIMVLGLIFIAGCYIGISRHSAPFLYDEAGDIPFRETALVLGTAKLTHRGNANRYFSNRIEAATKLFRENKCRVLIVSGADKHHPLHREANEMKNALVENGIPAGAIIPDHAGYRTWDSLWRCRGSFGSHTITVISQRFHLERAVFIGHKQGFNIIGFMANKVTGRLAARMFLRECLARVKCILDCYLLHPKPIYMRKMSRNRKRRRSK